MIIENPTNWKSATKYFKIYGKRIEALFPEIRDIEIIIEKMCSLQKDGINPLEYKEKVSLDNIVNIYYDEDVINTITDEKLIFAFISHELGHITAHYKQQDREGTKGEIIADNYAFKLGLGKVLLKALILLRTNYKNNRDVTFDFLPGISECNTKYKEEIDGRIENLEKQLKKTSLCLLNCKIGIKVMLYRIHTLFKRFKL